MDGELVKGEDKGDWISELRARDRGRGQRIQLDNTLGSQLLTPFGNPNQEKGKKSNGPLASCTKCNIEGGELESLCRKLRNGEIRAS